MRGSYLLPSQLPGEHTGHKAASMCSEPTWNAHYSSTHHQCWYSFYLPHEGMEGLSQPPARLSWEWVLNPRPIALWSGALPTELSQQILSTVSSRFYSIYIKHGCCRLLADGYRIFNMECHCSFTIVLYSRSQHAYPQQ